MLEKHLDSSLREILPKVHARIIDGSTTYFGIKTLKNPMDFWVYQEILTRRPPDVIVEIGNYRGGSTLALAHLCDLVGYGRVIGVDISHQYLDARVLEHPRISFVTGNAPSVAHIVSSMIEPHERVMIIEDSSHTYENTLAVLHSYSPLVKSGDYFIVEDGSCHHGLDVGPNPGPYEAIVEFLKNNNSFEIDLSCENFILTLNPIGFLRKK